MFSEFIETFICLRGISTPAINFRPSGNSDIYRSDIDGVHFGFFCVVSYDLTSGIHYFLHIMGLMSSVPPI